MKKIISVFLILTLATVTMTSCGKKSDVVTYDAPEEPKMKISGMDSVNITAGETYTANEAKIELTPIEEIKLDLGDNVTPGDLDKMDNISQEALQLLLDKQKSLLSDLADAFRKEGIKVTIDEKNGDIALDATILFATDKSDVSQEGQEFLAKFMPIYTSVIFDKKYEGFVSKIIVEGHTDTDGDYNYNKKLSQNRADNVKEFCKSDASGISEEYRSLFNSMVESKGYSYDRPIKDSSGKVDMAASRRVSFRFMINIK